MRSGRRRKGIEDMRRSTEERMGKKKRKGRMEKQRKGLRLE
jgi:hypothetical protein